MIPVSHVDRAPATMRNGVLEGSIRDVNLRQPTSQDARNIAFRQ